MKKALSIIMVMCIAFCSFAGIVAAADETDGMTIRTAENTTVVITGEQVELLLAAGLSKEEIEAAAAQQVNADIKEKGLFLSCDTQADHSLFVQTRASLPPGSRTETISGSNVGKVWAGIPAIGPNPYIYISYTYNYTKWFHDLYQVGGCIVNSGTRVITSSLQGVSWGKWTHKSGSIEYVESSYGKNLEVTAVGDLVYPVSIKIGIITIPANVTTQQSFLYFHAV